MDTPAQIDANRANPRKSTGPRFAEGADAAPIVIPGENPSGCDAFAANNQRAYRPEPPSESFHAAGVMRNL
jgi:hypothetical protein